MALPICVTLALIAATSAAVTVRKCCQSGWYFHADESNCTAFSVNADQPDATTDYVLEYSDPWKCSKFFVMELKEVDVHENGTVSITEDETVDACLDFVLEKDELFSLDVLVCGDNWEDDDSNNKCQIGMMISIPFLVVTLLVYVILPDRNNPAKILMCFVSSLIMAYLTLVLLSSDVVQQHAACITFALICYYFFMASFLWMTVSCIDIYWTFSGLRGFGGSKRSELKRFLFYAMYAYGLPVLMFAVVLGMNYHRNTTDKTEFYHPMIGEGQCWFKHGYPTLLYFYGPMSVMIVINIVLFALTAAKIRQVRKETAMLKRNDSRRHNADERERFELYVKLLFAMGVNWTMEVISWAVDYFYSSDLKYVWWLTDLCNALYGVCIFFIFVFKRKTWTQLKKRYYACRGQIEGTQREGETMLSHTEITLTSSVNNKPGDKTSTCLK